jgi:hypothetical protein
MTRQRLTVWARRAALLAVAAGVLVQACIAASFTRWDSVRRFDVALFFFLLPASPYIVPTLLLPFKRLAVVAATCALAVLAASLYVLWVYLAAGSPHTGGFAYVLPYMPLWTWAFVVPAGAALGLLFEWRLGRNTAKP